MPPAGPAPCQRRSNEHAQNLAVALPPPTRRGDAAAVSVFAYTCVWQLDCQMHTHTHEFTRRHMSSGTDTPSRTHMHAQHTFSVYSERWDLVRVRACVLGGAHSRGRPTNARIFTRTSICTHACRCPGLCQCVGACKRERYTISRCLASLHVDKGIMIGNTNTVCK
jgi:hypothetical protein